jgi:hypothetical protein
VLVRADKEVKYEYLNFAAIGAAKISNVTFARRRWKALEGNGAGHRCRFRTVILAQIAPMVDVVFV